MSTASNHMNRRLIFNGFMHNLAVFCVTNGFMKYSKYFKTGQKMLLRSMGDSHQERFEALTCYFQTTAPGFIDVFLPYGAENEEAYPFASEMPFELRTEALGLGLRIPCVYHSKFSDHLIRFSTTNEMQVFQHRLTRRVDVDIHLGYTKGQGTLRSYRDQWERNVQILKTKERAIQLPDLPQRRVNISAGGIRFLVKNPVQTADLCLLLLKLPPTEPICTLAEVVWTGRESQNGGRIAGMQFINIMEEDRRVIERFVRDTSDFMNSTTRP